MTKSTLRCMLLLVLTTMVLQAQDQRIFINMGTLAPAGTAWYDGSASDETGLGQNFRRTGNSENLSQRRSRRRVHDDSQDAHRPASGRGRVW